jgi:hypothetical protein
MLKREQASPGAQLYVPLAKAQPVRPGTIPNSNTSTNLNPRSYSCHLKTAVRRALLRLVQLAHSAPCCPYHTTDRVVCIPWQAPLPFARANTAAAAANRIVRMPAFKQQQQRPATCLLLTHMVMTDQDGRRDMLACLIMTYSLQHNTTQHNTIQQLCPTVCVNKTSCMLLDLAMLCTNGLQLPSNTCVVWCRVDTSKAKWLAERPHACHACMYADAIKSAIAP